MRRLLALLILLAAPAWAATYYVDCNAANDSDTGLVGHPWKTINKVNISSFSAGDSILFNKGCTWREQLTVPSSGSAGKPITFGAYGTGPDPIIKGSDLITGFAELTPTWVEIWNSETQVSSSSWADSGANNNNWRVYVNAAYTSASATTIRLKLKQSGTASWSVSSMYIGPKKAASDAFDFTTTPTQVLKGTAGNFTVAQGAGTEYTDSLSFSFDGATDYLVAFYTTNPSNCPRLTGATEWYSSAPDTSSTVDVTGLSSDGHIRGINAIESYVDAPADVWSVALTTEPKGVWFDGVAGQLKASAAACTAERDWYWAASVLYVYSTEDPATAYTDPGIEATQRDRVVQVSGKSYITVDNLDASQSNINLVNLSSSNYCIVSACYIHDTPKGGIGIYQGTAAHQIIRNEIARTGVGNGSNGQGCAIMGSSGTGGSGNIIEQNYIHDWGGVGGDHAFYDQIGSNTIRHNWISGGTGRALYAVGSNDAFYGNVVTDIAGAGVGIGSGSSGTLVYNNTFYDMTYPIQTLTGAAGVTVKNNIFDTIATRLYDIAVTTSVVINNNIINSFVQSQWGGAWSNYLATWRTDSSQDASTAEADPLFTNAAAGDFTLQAGSPCIDAGVDLTSTYQTALMPGSSWPSAVLTGNQYNAAREWISAKINGQGAIYINGVLQGHGTGSVLLWEIGAYLYPSKAQTLIVLNPEN